MTQLIYFQSIQAFTHFLNYLFNSLIEYFKPINNPSTFLSGLSVSIQNKLVINEHFLKQKRGRQQIWIVAVVWFPYSKHISTLYFPTYIGFCTVSMWLFKCPSRAPRDCKKGKRKKEEKKEKKEERKRKLFGTICISSRAMLSILQLVYCYSCAV